jgi:hypothetical protein
MSSHNHLCITKNNQVRELTEAPAAFIHVYGQSSFNDEVKPSNKSGLLHSQAFALKG